jgi:hypothetical protein
MEREGKEEKKPGIGMTGLLSCDIVLTSDLVDDQIIYLIIRSERVYPSIRTSSHCERDGFWHEASRYRIFCEKTFLMKH